MIDMAQGDVPPHGDLLKTVSAHHDTTFGLWATVIRTGRVALGDTLTPAAR
ncbi:hypothetical protein [Micromonospora sp. DT231]|uniref:hypothetical protein n=1 Tax=Micromonospora sp. DT231 TaxID=3416526 RepID=UPI003CF0B7FF